MEKEHQCLQNTYFVILSSGFWNNTGKRKISEEHWMKDLRQEKPIELMLFN